MAPNYQFMSTKPTALRLPSNFRYRVGEIYKPRRKGVCRKILAFLKSFK